MNDSKENNLIVLDIEGEVKNNIISNNKKEKIEIKKTNMIFYILLFYFIFTLIFIIILNIIEFSFIAFIHSIILLLLFNFLILCFKTKKYAFTKNEDNNLLIINKINYFSLSIYKLDINIKDIIIDIIPLFSYLNGYSIVIIKKLTNEKDIDINSGDIINCPIKLFYLFEDIEYKYINSKNELCEFIDNSPEVENPLFFNI